jgi:hypothetical protein
MPRLGLTVELPKAAAAANTKEEMASALVRQMSQRQDLPAWRELASVVGLVEAGKLEEAEAALLKGNLLDNVADRAGRK